MAQTTSYESRLSGSLAYSGKHWMNPMVLNLTQANQQESEYYTQLDERLSVGGASRSQGPCTIVEIQPP
jgi:hypothetical protein